MKKELIIFLGILIILSIGFHYKEFLEYPMEHILALGNSGAYGLGSLHPIVFSLIIYILLWIPRAIVKIFKK